MPSPPVGYTTAQGDNNDDDDVDMESSPATQSTLSNELLNNNPADRARERAVRKVNGNQHGKMKKGQGRKFDELMASAFIERKEVNNKSELAPIYYCIGCDMSVRNPNRKRNIPHMIQCKVSRFNHV